MMAASWYRGYCDFEIKLFVCALLDTNRPSAPHVQNPMPLNFFALSVRTHTTCQRDSFSTGRFSYGGGIFVQASSPSNNRQYTSASTFRAEDELMSPLTHSYSATLRFPPIDSTPQDTQAAQETQDTQSEDILMQQAARK
jgi:hypothetical protein